MLAFVILDRDRSTLVKRVTPNETVMTTAIEDALCFSTESAAEVARRHLKLAHRFETRAVKVPETHPVVRTSPTWEPQRPTVSGGAYAGSPADEVAGA